MKAELPVVLERRLDLALRAQFDFLVRAGAVQRYHTETVLRPQTVAAHSFNVAWWCWMIHPTHEPSAWLLMAALSHDVEENITGDIPAPTKRALALGRGELRQMEELVLREAFLPDFSAALSQEEQQMLKTADILDGLAYCVRERQLGNRTLGAVWCNYRAYYTTYYANIPLNPRAHALFTRLGELYDAAATA